MKIVIMTWESDFINYNGNKIHYFYGGDKNNSPLILLHGAMDNGMCWSPIGEKLWDKYFVIMPDARFHGLTEVADNKFSLKLMAQDVAALIKELKLNSVQIMGHSMGSQMNALVASLYPELDIKKIVLEDPFIRFKTYSKITKWIFKLSTPFVKAFFSGDYEKLYKKGRKLNPKWSEEELKPWAESKILYIENNPKKLLNMLEQDIDWENVFRTIQCPILLITSNKGLTKKKSIEKITSNAKNCKWVKINGAGHNIRREQVQRFMEEIEDFLD
jgi:N-formylmaleamate deformylase